MANKKGPRYYVGKGVSIFGHRNVQLHEGEEVKPSEDPKEGNAPASQLARWIKTGFVVEKKAEIEKATAPASAPPAPALPSQIEDGEKPDERKGTPEDSTTKAASKVETTAQEVVKQAKAATVAATAPKNPPRAIGKWNVDPATIKDKKLPELNVMIRERGGAPVKDLEEARALLSADYKG